MIPISKPSVGDLELQYVSDAVRSGWVSSLGPYIEKFEARFADYCGVKYALTASNGTTALHLALATLDIGPGDEVVVPDLTFIATGNAVRYTGASVVPVDVDRDTLCLSPQAVSAAVTDRTRAVIPVHLYGHPADMDELAATLEGHDIRTIEDAAEAHGAEYKGRRVGSLGDVGVFSFYGNKIITTGEGGMLTTDRLDIYERARYLRDHAMSRERRYWHDEVGFNYRMTNIQAALGVAQLEQIDAFLAKRRNIIGWYRENFAGVDGRLRLNQEAPWAKSAYWMVCLEVEELTESSRSSLMASLRAKGVDSRPYFYPMSEMPMYGVAHTPVAHRVSPTGINLPSFFDMTRDEVDYCCDQVKAGLKDLGLL